MSTWDFAITAPLEVALIFEKDEKIVAYEGDHK